MTSQPPHPNDGLDTLRALAIVLVFAYDYMIFVSGTPTFGWASEIGWVGVDLFFVLSGYLIADQILAGMVRGERLSLTRFYARRAWRIGPAFWVVLAAYFVFPYQMGGTTPAPLWRFLTFSQNIGVRPGSAFSHAWSLCIEMQFYLVLPLVALALCRFVSRRALAWSLVGALIVIGVVSRSILWTRYGREALDNIDAYYPAITTSTLCRFDEFLPGVAVAMLRHLHPQRWQRAMARGRKLLGAGLAATGLMLYAALRFYSIEGYGYGFFMSAFGYSLLAMAFALLVMATQSPASWLADLRIPGAHQLALWSYSMYLTHKPVAYIVQRHARLAGASAELTSLIVVVACIAAGALLYTLVETPLMALRHRCIPSSFRRAVKPDAA